MKEKMTTATTAITFADLLRSYETHATDPTAKPHGYASALQNVGSAVAYSVLKKCIDTSNNPTLTAMRRELTADLHSLANLEYATANATALRYNADGDLRLVVLDKDLYKAIDDLCGDRLGDGLDLVNDAVLAILAETESARERNGGVLPPCFMETPYSVRRLKRKVWIKAEDSADGWETITTTPVQEVYKAVRRAIEKSRAVQTDPRNGYTYIDDIATDPDSGVCETIYHRYGKFADLGGHLSTIDGKTDYNGYTADRTTAEQTTADFADLVTRLNLTARQAQIIDLRMRGYGYKAIATYLGVAVGAVRTQLARVQDKCTAIGFSPAMWAEMTADK